MENPYDMENININFQPKIIDSFSTEKTNVYSLDLRYLNVSKITPKP